MPNTEIKIDTSTLEGALKYGMGRWRIRNFSGMPNKESIAETYRVYYADLRLANLTDNDAARILFACEAAGRQCERWPTPADVLKRLPPAHLLPGKGLCPKLPPPNQRQLPGRKATKAENRAGFAELWKILKRGTTA